MIDRRMTAIGTHDIGAASGLRRPWPRGGLFTRTAFHNVDVEGKIVLVNERTEYMFGYPRAELIGRPVEMLMPARTRQIHTTHRREYNQFNRSPHARTMGLGLKLIALRCDGLEFPMRSCWHEWSSRRVSTISH
jgi:PAS domain S-box-containing protein